MTSKRQWVGAIAAWLLLVLAPQAVRAQSASASLAGRVQTDDGVPVVGAVVEAMLDATGLSRATSSDRRGRYSFEGLPPGEWTVAARLGNETGLTDTRRVTLRLQQSTTVDFSIGKGIAEEVVVRSTAPLVDRKETAGKLTVTGERANTLPVAGRVLTDLALLDSSVRQAAPGTFVGERGAVFTVNGQSGRSNSFLVDGLDNNDSVSGTSMNSFFSQQVIQEFVLLTHQYSPEFGGASGGLLNVVTRRGSNEQEWNAFVQGTTDGWNSTGSFVESLPESGVSQDSVQRFQVGSSVGGAFREDRAFYFAAYEHQQANDLIPFTGVDRDGNAGGRSVGRSEDDSLFVRTDFNLGTKHSLMVRASANDRSAGGINVGGVFTPESGFAVDEQDLQLAATLTSVVAPKVLSETRLLLSRSKFDQVANSSLPGVTRPSGIFGGNVLNQQARDEDKLQLVQNLTWRTGAHTVKLGVDVTRSTTDISARFNPNGNFLYNYDIPFETGDCGIDVTQIPNEVQPGGWVLCQGDPNQVDDDGDGLIDELANIYSYPWVYTLVDGQPSATLDDTRIAIFAQDKLDLGQRWLLEYGLRYDLSTYELPSSAGVDSIIPNGGSTRDTNNIAPRLGFTFLPRAGGKLVVRGGGGVFYDKLVLAFPAVASITSGTRIGLIPLQGLAFEDLTEESVIDSGGFPLASPEPLTLRFSTGTELDTPYSVQWNLGLERTIGARHALRADLVRSQGYRLPILKDLNPVTGLVPGTYGLPILTGALTACPVDQIDPELEIGVPCHARDPEKGSIAAIVTEGKSWYTGLDLNYRWQGDPSWFQASYTLSRAEDLGFDPLKGGIALPPDSDDIQGERGRSDGDRLHRLVLSGDVALPWGMRSSAVMQVSSGLPYNVTTGQDDNFDGILTDRPEGVGRNDGEDSSVAAINAVRDQEVVPLAPIASLPDEPSFFQVDLRLYKQFALKADGASELFLQVFNLLDRENIGLIEGRAISPNFGKPITLAGPPRTLELGLRVRY